MKPGEFDMTFAGATSARFAALQAGAVDAAILTPPFNFHAQSAGFNNLGNTIEYADMPFAGIGGEHHMGGGEPGRRSKSSSASTTRSIAWLYDPTNRDEAVQILMRVSKLKKEDVDKAYDFLIQRKISSSPPARSPRAR